MSNIKHHLLDPLKNNKGFVLILAIVALVVMMAIGISSTRTSRMELQIASNEKFHEMAFYQADAGIFSLPDFIKIIISENKGVDEITTGGTGDFIYATNSTHFFRQITGYDVYDSAIDMKYGANVTGTSLPLFEVDIERVASKHKSGGGLEFGSGYEGAGVGPKGGVSIIYRETSTGYGPHGAESEIQAYYREVVN